VNALQRTLLRKTLKITRPNKISNDKLYEITKLKPWSVEIKTRKLKWFGHLCRLPSDAPARKALDEALKPTKKPQGRPKTTWLQSIKKDLKEINITNIEKAIEIAQNYVNKNRYLPKGSVINPTLSEPKQYQWEVLKEQPIVSKAIHTESHEDKEIYFIFEEIVIDLLNVELITY
jgi:hypothetical protein